MKNEKYAKSLTIKIKLFNFIFLYGKGYILLENIVSENVICIDIFLVIFF